MLLASGTYLNGAGRDGLGPEPRHVLLKVIGFGSDAGRRAAHPFPPLFLPSLEVALDGLPELSCGLGLRPQASVLPPEPSVLPREPPAFQQPVSHPQRPGAHRSEQGVGARLGCLGRFARKNHRAKHREKLFGIAFFRVFSFCGRNALKRPEQEAARRGSASQQTVMAAEESALMLILPRSGTPLGGSSARGRSSLWLAVRSASGGAWGVSLPP